MTDKPLDSHRYRSLGLKSSEGGARLGWGGVGGEGAVSVSEDLSHISSKATGSQEILIEVAARQSEVR